MEDYVTYEQAKKLKELGFDWKCIYWYRIKDGNNLGLTCMYDTHNTSEKGIYAPTLSQAAKWLREVKEICVTSSIKIHEGKYKFNWNITLFKEDRDIWDESVIYDTYEEALTAGIDRVLEIL